MDEQSRSETNTLINLEHLFSPENIKDAKDDTIVRYSGIIDLIVLDAYDITSGTRIITHRSPLHKVIAYIHNHEDHLASVIAQKHVVDRTVNDTDIQNAKRLLQEIQQFLQKGSEVEDVKGLKQLYTEAFNKRKASKRGF